MIYYYTFVKDGYLIRKTITDEFSTSAFVIQFKEQAEGHSRKEILHKIFCYLDTCSDWQFSLFDYADVADVKVESIPGSLVYRA